MVIRASPLPGILGTLLLGALPHPLPAQGVLLDARMELSLAPTEGSLQVGITYRLLTAEEAAEIPLSLLTPGSTHVDSLRASMAGGAGGEPEVKLPAPLPGVIRKHYWEGSVPLPAGRREAGDTLVLRFIYTVGGVSRDGGRVEVPILAVRWNPQVPAPRTFLATVGLPPGISVTGSFPTSVAVSYTHLTLPTTPYV
jgi:hypothetical protein